MQLTKSLLHTTDLYIKRLNEAGIETTSDFIHLFPKDYEDKSDVGTKFSLLNIKEKQAVKCRIELLTNEMTRNKKLLIKAILTDSDGMHAEAVWFNQRIILSKFAPGDSVLIFGKPKYEYGRLSFPSCEIEHFSTKRQEIIPIYSDVNYIPGVWIRDKMVYMKEFLDTIGEELPQEIREKKGFQSHVANIRMIHFPKDIADFDRAKGELGYEELFRFQYIGVKKKKDAQAKSEGLAPQIPLDIELMKSLIAGLSFALTNKQKIVLFQMLKDMEQPHAMARLLQGDVGTGKTVVALLAAIHGIVVYRKNNAYHREEEGEFEGNEKRSHPGVRSDPGNKNLDCHIDFLQEPKNLLAMTEASLQVAIMAPTEILARQHFAGSEAWLMGLDIRSDLLVGSLTPRMKEAARERLKRGETDIIFGTHALIQESVQFARLGFVVVDEQHRFGVQQRKALEEYCSHGMIKPHRLNMSATPIPRTLALTVYGDQDISVLDEYPAGRKSIHTRVVREDQRVEIYRFVEEEVRAGRQVYWISPLVDGSQKTDDRKEYGSSGIETVGAKKKREKGGAEQEEAGFLTTETFDTLGYKSMESISKENTEDIASAVEMQITLSSVFPKLTIGLIHGKMSGKEKDRVMQEFYENKIHVLSSTSVVEVGVNNPNATIMCIEAAERFGLSQLHQFRGRVGRGVDQSYCYLFTTKEYKSDRLKAMERTNDGFELAEIDLELRGPGEVYGVRQSGVPDFHFADLRDVNLISEIREDIEEWIKGKNM